MSAEYALYTIVTEKRSLIAKHFHRCFAFICHLTSYLVLVKSSFMPVFAKMLKCM